MTTTAINGHCAWCKESPTVGEEHECDGVRTYRRIERTGGNLVRFGTMVGTLRKGGFRVREAGELAAAFVEMPERKTIHRSPGTWQ